MSHRSSDENTNISEYEDKSYGELKNRIQNVKTWNENIGLSFARTRSFFNMLLLEWVKAFQRKELHD